MGNLGLIGKGVISNSARVDAVCRSLLQVFRQQLEDSVVNKHKHLFMDFSARCRLVAFSDRAKNFSA